MDNTDTTSVRTGSELAHGQVDALRCTSSSAGKRTIFRLLDVRVLYNGEMLDLVLQTLPPICGGHLAREAEEMHR